MLIDFKEIIDKKNEQIKEEYMKDLLRFKNPDTVQRIIQKLYHLETLSPNLFNRACDWIDNQLAQSTSEPVSIPDIIA
jgi:hypothetical protein